MTATILLVEDEASIAEAVEYTLQSEGFRALVARSGGEADRRLQDGPVDLVVLDVGLPDVNGFDWCRNLRATSRVPVIFLTARSEEVDRVVGLELGGDDYLTKPFSPRELTARIRAILRRTRDGGTGEGGSLSVGPFRLDPDRHRIEYDGHALELSRLEYRLLEVLLRRPGHVFSRERLMALAWTDAECSLPRTVDTHIKTLRGKLRAVQDGDGAIVTHRGLGYALREYP